MDRLHGVKQGPTMPASDHSSALDSSALDSAQTLLNFSDDMLAMLDTNLRYVALNDAYARMFGRPRSDFIGHTIEEAFAHDPEHYCSVIQPIMEECLRGNPVRYERWIPVPQFGDLYLDIHYSPAKDANGRVIGITVAGRNRTEVMRSIEALQRNETMLNRTENIAHLGGWYYDLVTDVTHWTNEMYEIHEVPRDFPLTQENIQRFVPESELAHVLQGIGRAMRGEPTEITSRMITATGKVKWVRSICFPIIENGRVVSIEGVLQDISELTETQLRFQQSEEKYRRLVEETNALVWEGDISPARFTYISPQAEKLTGFPTEAWMRPNFLWERVLPEERDETFAAIARKIAAHEDFVIEYRFIRADGSLMWLHDDVKIIYDAIGEPVKFRGVMIDITRMKEMQAGLGRALRSLENYKYILDRHAIVASADREGLIHYVNAKFIEITGYERDELIGQRHSLLKSGLHSAAFYNKLWSTIAAGQVWQGEICNRRKNGDLYWVYTTIVPLLDEQGNIEEYMSVSTEVTELKRTEESLRRAQKMEAIGQLTGGIAHDFNNLLSIVIGNIELVEMSLPPQELLHRQLENARNAAVRGSVLTRRLLNFSHQTPVLGQAMNLNAVMQGIEVLVSKSLTALVKVELDLAADLWLVEVDPGDFEDAIINLSINASDAMPQGGKLRFSTRNVETTHMQFRSNGMIPPGKYVEITVEDSGIGMDADVLDKIFEPYFTTKPSDKGSGLGLPMVYGFVQRSKGLIFVDSTPGAGTRFTIYLPKSGQATSRTGIEAPPSPSQAPAARHDETILLVDDEADILKITRTNLENLGYRILIAQNGDEALAVLQRHQEIDLLFTDIVMPGSLNGFELAEAALALRPDLKLLFTTGYAKVEGGTPRDEWREAIIQKPYRSAEISRRIRAMLDQPR
jgi:PAS domain S-box-containing protein